MEGLWFSDDYQAGLDAPEFDLFRAARADDRMIAN